MDPQNPPPEAVEKLAARQNLWFCSVRPNGKPHLVPVWFVWHAGKIYIGTDPQSVKIDNIRRNPQVVVSLEDGTHPVIAEGAARILPGPYPEALLAVFMQKYEWDVPADPQYHLIVEVTPTKWLVW